MENKDFKILYVDDEKQNLISFQATFRRDYTIFTALSGNEAIEIIKNEDIHLIISDQRMPEMTGVQFFEKILHAYPDPVRMILTGYSDVEAVIDAINNGRVFRYISKPWDENELRMNIENARFLYDIQKKNKAIVRDLQSKIEEQERTLRLFIKYAPENIVEKNLAHNEDSMLEGELKYVTVLFCDIRGFTSVVEYLQPKEIVSLLNDYYSILTEVVQKHNGSVIQYVGDEIFAAFGAHVEYPNNEENAVFCAMEMINKLDKLNEKYRNKLGKKIEVGIGINAGDVVAGNLGSEVKIEYALTGEAVNTGKRIESLTINNPNKVLISESVYKKISQQFNFKEWEPVQVKGKTRKITVYEILGLK